MIYKDLVDIAYKWLLREGGCATAIRTQEDSADTNDYPDIIGLGSFGRSVVVQIYASREEFEIALENQFWQIPNKQLGRYRFVCAPAGLIKEEEVPANWGLLTINEKGQAIISFNPYAPSSVDFWRNGFEDQTIYDLLGENEKIYAVCRRFRYASILRVDLQ